MERPRPRAPRGEGRLLEKAAAVAPRDQRASHERLEEPAGAGRPLDARLEDAQGLLRHMDEGACGGVDARDLAGGAEPRPTGLVALDGGRDRPGDRGGDAAAVVDAPRGSRRPPLPGGRRCRWQEIRHGTGLVWVAGAGAGAAGTGAGAATAG